MIDVYQSMTQVSDEMDETLSTTTQIHTLLDNALGPKDYWGVFNVILHSDHGDHTRPNELVGDAQRRGVPVITSAQMLSWLDSRNGSSFGNIAYSGNQLTFTLSAHSGARGLKAMLPASSGEGPLARLRRDGQTVSWNRKTIKGVDYVDVRRDGRRLHGHVRDRRERAGRHRRRGHVRRRGPRHRALDHGRGVDLDRAYGRTTALGFEVEDTALVTDHSVELSGLQPATTYRFQVTSADAAGNSVTAPDTPPRSRRRRRAGRLAHGRVRGRHDRPVPTPATRSSAPTARSSCSRRSATSSTTRSSAPSWSTELWRQGGSLRLAGGALFTDSGVAYSGDPLPRPRTIEFIAAFQPVNDQGVGLGGATSATSRTRSSRSGLPGDPFGVYAISGAAPGQTCSSQQLPQREPLRPHRFRIEWTPSVIRYYVDGALVASHNVIDRRGDTPGRLRLQPLRREREGRLAAHEQLPDHGHVHLADARQRAGRQRLADAREHRAVDHGHVIGFETRSGATRQPNASWSAWQPVSGGGAIASPNTRFLQYRATLNGSAHVTPTLQRVPVTYGAGTDQAPVTGTVSLAPASPRTNQTLTATVSGFSDPDGDPLTYHYEWFRNGTQIPGATTSSLNLRAAGNGDLGDRIRVEVYATDGHGAASDPASTKVTVANTAPTAGTVTTRPVPAATKDVMRAVTTGFADIDGDELTLPVPVADQRQPGRRGDRRDRSTSTAASSSTTASTST